jgi:hypothetical protein
MDQGGTGSSSEALQSNPKGIISKTDPGNPQVNRCNFKQTTRLEQGKTLYFEGTRICSELKAKSLLADDDDLLHYEGQRKTKVAIEVMTQILRYLEGCPAKGLLVAFKLNATQMLIGLTH